MEFEADELLALYVIEHPEDESGITTMLIDGTETQLIRKDVLVRFAHWGAESGYFDKQKAREFIPWAEQLNAGEAEQPV
jgi:hypothetical protein